MGREVFERALKDPDSLADIELGPEDPFFEEFAYIAAEAYEKKTQAELPPPERLFPEEPAGDRWEEDSDDLAKRFPRLWAKYGS